MSYNADHQTQRDIGFVHKMQYLKVLFSLNCTWLYLYLLMPSKAFHIFFCIQTQQFIYYEKINFIEGFPI